METSTSLPGLHEVEQLAEDRVEQVELVADREVERVVDRHRRAVDRCGRRELGADSVKAVEQPVLVSDVGHEARLPS